MRNLITTSAVIAIALLIYPQSLSSQNNFSLSLDVNGAAGNQTVTSVNVSPDQVVDIQIFGSGIQNAVVFSLRFEYDASQVVYDSFMAGNVLPNVTGFPEIHDTNFVEVTVGALGGQATVNSGLIGTIRFRTTTAFSNTSIRLVRGTLGRGGQTETITPNVNVELQSGTATSPTPDFNGDGIVDSTDYALFIFHWGTQAGGPNWDPKFDLNSDGVINSSDYALFVSNWGKTFPPSGGGQGGNADLVVGIDPIGISHLSLTPGQSFVFWIGVTNRGTDPSGVTTLRYYQSNDATISNSDTQVGSTQVPGLAADATSGGEVTFTAPSRAGTYYYGACVESVSGESNTNNNCSGVEITVIGGGLEAGPIRRLTYSSGRGSSDPAWSPDGRFIAFTSEYDDATHDAPHQIDVMNADGSNLTNLTNNTAGGFRPSWSPDGRFIAFESYRDGNSEIYVMNADGSNPRNLTNNPASDWDFSWSPDGRFIAFESYRDGNSEIYVMNADGSNPRRLTNNTAYDGEPSWSPDGRFIAFESSRDDYRDEIYVMNADGSNPRRLTNNNASDSDPVWSPDGRFIAFESYRDGNYEIYVMNADGSNLTNLTNNTASDSDPVWSPDGRFIAFVSYRDGNYEIYVMNADGSNLTNLTNNPASDRSPSWSPDSRFIAFESYRDGKSEIYVMDLQVSGGG
ncbi:MAG: DUF5050 domain-containing protein [Candidatus Poribacteria bacterium]|nr:DUF5050 domain-containing protein [Candidatus Poribacteria bacterium]